MRDERTRGEPPSLFLLLTSGLAFTLLYKLYGAVFFKFFDQPHLGLIVAGVAGILLPLALLLRSVRNPAALVRAHPATPWSLLLAAGVALAAVPPVLALTSLLTRTAPHLERMFLELLQAHTPAQFALVVFAAALLPAFAEEILFRGYLLTGLQRRLGTAPAILATSVWFGVIHGAERGPGAFFLGILLGWLTVRANSIAPAIAAHFAVNSFAILHANGWLTPAPFGAGTPIGLIVCVVGGAACVLAFARLNRS